MTESEKRSICTALVAFLDDFARLLRKTKHDPTENKVYVQVERVTYTEFIPDSWCGPKPKYWEKFRD